jgi:predicted MFS family arabinose efflux permease
MSTSTGSRTAEARATGSPAAVATVFAVAGIASTASFARIPSVRDHVGATPQLLSLALVCVGLGSLATMPFTGRITERIGSGMTVRLFTALAVLSWSMVSIAPNLILLGAALFVCGAGFGVWDVAMNIQGALVEQRRNTVLMPMLHAVFSFGAVAGALLGALFARLGLSIQVQFPVVWIAGLVTVLVATSRFLDDRHPDLIAADAKGEQAAPAAGTGGSGEGRRGVSRIEILIGVMMACTALGEGAANDWLAITMVDTRSVPESVGAIALAGFNVTMAIARLVGGKLIGSLGRVPVLRVSGVLAVTGVLLLALVNSPVVALAGALLWGLGLAVVFPSGVSAAGELGGRGPRSIALASTVGYGGFLLGAPLIGQLTHFVRIDHALIAVAVAAAVVVLIAPVTRERGPRSEVLAGAPGEELPRGA